MKTIAISIILMYCSFLQGQTEKPEKSYWLNSGLGIYCSQQKAGYSWNIMSLQKIYNPYSWKIKLMYFEEIAVLNESPTERICEADFLLGKSTGNNDIRISFHYGFGLAGGFTRGDYSYPEDHNFFRIKEYEKKDFFTPCFPVEASVNFIAIENTVEFRITALGNLNWVSSRTGLMFGIALKLC